jgi:hypothetical protein
MITMTEITTPTTDADDLVDTDDREARIKARISSITRMWMLPEVFSLQDAVVLLDISKQLALKYSSRWKSYGLVAALGKTGVYFNLQRCPTQYEHLIPEAVSKAVRRPIVEIGGSVLSRHGWTQQRHRLPEYAVSIGTKYNRTLPTITGVHLCGRPHWWMTALSPQHDEAVRSTSAAGALADLVLADFVNKHNLAVYPKPQTTWRPDRDDVRNFRDDPKGMAEVKRWIGSIISKAPDRGVFMGWTAEDILMAYLQQDVTPTAVHQIEVEEFSP